jgi:hypothetical protein
MKYTITNTENGWMLKIWEPASVQGDRLLPFLYKIKSLHSSEAEAKAALAEHEQVNRYGVPRTLRRVETGAFERGLVFSCDWN